MRAIRSPVRRRHSASPAYAPSADPGTGYLLFVREGTLMAQPFDNRRMTLKGQAAAVAERVSVPFDGAVWRSLSASSNGVLAFPSTRQYDAQLTWYDQEGKVIGTVGEPGLYQKPRARLRMGPGWPSRR